MDIQDRPHTLCVIKLPTLLAMKIEVDLNSSSIAPDRTPSFHLHQATPKRTPQPPRHQQQWLPPLLDPRSLLPPPSTSTDPLIYRTSSSSTIPTRRPSPTPSPHPTVSRIHFPILLTSTSIAALPRSIPRQQVLREGDSSLRQVDYRRSGRSPYRLTIAPSTRSIGFEGSINTPGSGCLLAA